MSGDFIVGRAYPIYPLFAIPAVGKPFTASLPMFVAGDDAALAESRAAYQKEREAKKVAFEQAAPTITGSVFLVMKRQSESGGFVVWGDPVYAFTDRDDAEAQASNMRLIEEEGEYPHSFYVAEIPAVK